MAIAAAVAILSPHTGLLAPNPTKLLCSSSSVSPNLSFPPRHLFLYHHDTTLLKSPATNVCYAQLDCSTGEEPEDIGDVLFGDGNDMIQDDDDEDETESSLDLLIRFLQSMLKKLSKRAKKATRAMLPSVISPQLVSFAVDGILLLAALSIVKSLLEVVCTLGSSVFVAILLLRVIWAAISYFQSNGNTFNHDGSSLGMI